MADEIKIALTLDVAKGNLSLSFRPGQVTPDLSGSNYSAGSIDLNTSAYTDITVDAGVGSGGWCWFRNTSTETTTNPTMRVAMSASTSTPFARLYPGEYAVMRCHSTGIAALAVGTNAASLQYGILDA